MRETSEILHKMIEALKKVGNNEDEVQLIEHTLLEMKEYIDKDIHVDNIDEDDRKKFITVLLQVQKKFMSIH